MSQTNHGNDAQFDDETEAAQAKAGDTFERLVDTYGRPEWSQHREPVDELILTILSANTNDKNSLRAFKQIKATFGEDWDEVRNAPLDELKEAIRVAGMYNQKAPRIVETLTRILDDQGEYNLDHLAEMPVKEAEDYLTSLPGVGHKTASIVMLFCFNQGAFPVDTHVQRITQRLGLSSQTASPEKIKGLWEALMAPETYYPLHVNLIEHGRTLCTARSPSCDDCPLYDICDYALERGAWAE